MKKHVVLGILLIVIIIIAIPVSYFVALGVVSDAVFRLGFEQNDWGSIHAGTPNVSFVGNFIFTNGAGIPLALDYVKIAVYVFDDGRPYDGNLFYIGSTPPSDPHEIGSFETENELVPANGQVVVPAGFDVTSEDALNVIRSGNYTVGWAFHELTVSGSFLFWHFTPRIAIQ